jgi:hypothetical protein
MTHFNCSKTYALLFAIGSSFILAGCGSTMTLTMDPVTPIIEDDSAVSKNMPKYTRVMLVPPSGTATVAFEKNMAVAEREFIKRGLSLISPAVTSRVLEGVQTGGENSGKELTNAKNEVTKLSDVEKALIMAKRTNAEAIIQIGSFDQQAPRGRPGAARYFIKSPSGANMMEVDEKTYYNVMGSDTITRRGFGDYYVDFSGRLIDVQSGQVMASFHYLGYVMRAGKPYTETITDEGQTVNARYNWTEEKDSRMQAFYKELFSSIADRITKGAN